MKSHLLLTFLLLVVLSAFTSALIPGRCTSRGGSGLSLDCFPAGSKKSYADGECSQCSATGLCPYSKATGRCQLCDGRGFKSGRNNCTKTLG